MNASWEAIELRMQERGVVTLTRLAEISRVSVKSLTRIKNRKASNASTIERIAKALGSETADLLQPPDEARKLEAMKTLEKEGYREIAILMDRSTRLAYRLVCARYKVTFNTLFKFAPLFSVAVFQKSLAARRAKLDAFNDAFEAAMHLAPSHLATAQHARSDVDEAYRLEEDSITSNDLTGATIEVGFGGTNADNLFADFLREYTSDLDPNLIQIGDAWGLALDHIDFTVLKGDLYNLTNGDLRALFALEHEYGRVKDMPDDVRSSSDPAKRAMWLADRVPNDVWAAEERRSALLSSLVDITH